MGKKSAPCRVCGKMVTERTFGSGGGVGDIFTNRYGYVRCRPCTREMLRKSESAGFLRVK